MTIPAAPLSQRMQETVNGWRKEADDLDSAASEKYTGSEDGGNYHREDRHAMIVEAKLLRSKANELGPLVAGVAGLEARAQAHVDGYDLGILIRLERFGGFHELGWINSQAVSEVGWLGGGDAELFTRMAKLLSLGLVVIQTPQDDEPRNRYYDNMPQFKFVKYPEPVGVAGEATEK